MQHALPMGGVEGRAQALPQRQGFGDRQPPLPEQFCEGHSRLERPDQIEHAVLAAQIQPGHHARVRDPPQRHGFLLQPGRHGGRDGVEGPGLDDDGPLLSLVDAHQGLRSRARLQHGLHGEPSAEQPAHERRARVGAAGFAGGAPGRRIVGRPCSCRIGFD